MSGEGASPLDGLRYVARWVGRRLERACPIYVGRADEYFLCGESLRFQEIIFLLRLVTCVTRRFVGIDGKVKRVRYAYFGLQ